MGEVSEIVGLEALGIPTKSFGPRLFDGRAKQHKAGRDSSEGVIESPAVNGLGIGETL